MNQQIVKATKSSRLMFFGSCLLAVTVLAIAVYFKPWFHALVVSSRAEDARLVNRIAATWFFWLSCFPIYSAWMRRKILRIGQWPLPDAWVLRDTPVMTGDAATLRGYLIIIASIVACVCSATLALFFATLR
jgi:hypothetical protein